MAKDSKGRPPDDSQAKFPSKEAREFHRKLEFEARTVAESVCSSLDLEFPFSKGAFEQIERAFSKLSKRLALAEWCLFNQRGMESYQSLGVELELVWPEERRDET